MRLRVGEAALGQRRTACRHLRRAHLPVLGQNLQTLHLCRIDVNLRLCHPADFHIVQNLHVCLRHGEADVILNFRAVGIGGLKVQFAHIDVAAPEGEVLGSAGLQRGPHAILGRIQLYSPLLHCQCALLDRNVVLLRILHALLQGPRTTRLPKQDRGLQENYR